MTERYADVIIDISHEKVDRPFQYRIPERLRGKLQVGMCVNIPFGRGNKLREGYVIDLSDTPAYPEDKIKEIDSVSAAQVRAEGRSIELAWWMKKRYGSTMIAAMRTVIPVRQEMKPMQYKEVTLLASHQEACDLLAQARAKHQTGKERLLEALMDGATVSYTLLTTKLAVSPQTIRNLETQGAIRVDCVQSYRNPVHFAHLPDKKKILTGAQQAIVDAFLADYDRGVRTPALLHGMTGSGKTEVYMALIEGMLQRGKEAIVLIPEIALTYQTVLRFYERFGDIVSVVNSRLSQGERYDQFLRAKNGEVKVMIGPRSALFTPFEHLGLIVIDEEHETSYKSDAMPKYHAREVAEHLAEMTDACVFMGSATPSLEANYKAQKGLYRKYRLDSRIGEAVLPKVTVVDMKRELMGGNTSVLSLALQNKIEQRLAAKEQIMLFLNRRGMAGFVSCKACGYVPKCPHCDVSLSEHRNHLTCHYCGYETAKIKVCPSCGSRYIYGFKAGTEKIEDIVRARFPQAKILRMDADTTRKKGSYEKILAAFAGGEADILIGTQMIVKGHDFKRVTLVGVLAADTSLFESDYRSGERTFQLLTQASGRAGRGELPGEAVIQTYRPDHYSIEYSVKHDYDGFYKAELSYRQVMEYPPVCSMLAVLVSGRDEREVKTAAQKAREKAGAMRVIGPAPAALEKLSDMYRYVLYIKADTQQPLMEARERIEAFLQQEEALSNRVTVTFDMDPVHGY